MEANFNWSLNNGSILDQFLNLLLSIPTMTREKFLYFVSFAILYTLMSGILLAVLYSMSTGSNHDQNLSSSVNYWINILIYPTYAIALLIPVVQYLYPNISFNRLGLISVDSRVVIGAILMGLGTNGWMSAIERIMWDSSGSMQGIEESISALRNTLHYQQPIIALFHLTVAGQTLVFAQIFFFLGPLMLYFNQEFNRSMAILLVIFGVMIYNVITGSILFGMFSTIIIWGLMAGMTLHFRSLVPALITFTTSNFIQSIFIALDVPAGFLIGKSNILLYSVELSCLIIGWKIIATKRYK